MNKYTYSTAPLFINQGTTPLFITGRLMPRRLSTLS